MNTGHNNKQKQLIIWNFSCTSLNTMLCFVHQTMQLKTLNEYLKRIIIWDTIQNMLMENWHQHTVSRSVAIFLFHYISHLVRHMKWPWLSICSELNRYLFIQRYVYHLVDKNTVEFRLPKKPLAKDRPWFFRNSTVLCSDFRLVAAVGITG